MAADSRQVVAAGSPPRPGCAAGARVERVQNARTSSFEIHARHTGPWPIHDGSTVEPTGQHDRRSGPGHLPARRHPPGPIWATTDSDPGLARIRATVSSVLTATPSSVMRGQRAGPGSVLAEVGLADARRGAAPGRCRTRTMLPTSRTWPLSASLSAAWAFCSTSRIVVPWDLSVRDGRHDPLHHERRQAHRGLVEHEQLGPAHHGAAHGEHLLLAAGERAGRLLAALPEDREEVVGARACRCGCRAWSLRRKAPSMQVLLDAEPREDAPALGGVGEARARRSRGRRRCGCGLPWKRDLAADWACSSPERVRRVVVLPAPLVPMRVTTWPSSTEKVMPLTASILP